MSILSPLTDKERLMIVIENLEGYWADLIDDDAESKKLRNEDVATLREIAERLS